MTIEASAFLTAFRREGISFFCGVADSLLRPVNTELEGLADAVHVSAPNEGTALAMAAGHHLATGQVAVVYLQNSGLGNLVNPLLSLTDPSVYSIPAVLVVGWRGEPGRHDEPQHGAQGRLTVPLLEMLGVPHQVLPEDPDAAAMVVADAIAQARAESRPVAVVVPKGVIVGATVGAGDVESSLPTRGEVIEWLLDSLPDDTVFVATTGYTGRELAQIRLDRGETGERDFLMVGSMGHASSLALGMALGDPSATICCLDGDGAFAMHMGAVTAIGRSRPSNLVHVLINNGVHESVGGQPTSAAGADLSTMAAAAGYGDVVTCSSGSDIRAALDTDAPGPRFIEVAVRAGAPSELIRPEGLVGRKTRLMQSLSDG